MAIAAVGASEKRAVARNAKPLVGYNCEKEFVGSSCGCDDAKATILSSQESLHQQISITPCEKYFFSVVRMKENFRADMPVLREKSSSLRVHSQHTSGWFASHRKFSLPRIISGFFEAVLGGDSRTLPFKELLSIAVHIFRMTLNLLARMFFILLIFWVFFSENFPSFLSGALRLRGDENSRTNGKIS